MASTSKKVPVEFKTARGTQVLVSAQALAAAEEWLKRMNCNDDEDDVAVAKEVDEFENDISLKTPLGIPDKEYDSFDDDSVFEEPKKEVDSIYDDDFFDKPVTPKSRPITPAASSMKQIPSTSTSTPSRTPLSSRRFVNPSNSSHTPSRTFSTNSVSSDFSNNFYHIPPKMTIRNHSSVYKPFKTPTIGAEARAEMMARHQENRRKRKSVDPTPSPMVVPPLPKVLTPSPMVLPPSPMVLPSSSRVLPPSPMVVPPLSRVLPPSSMVVPPSSRVLPSSSRVLPSSPMVVPPLPKVLTPSPMVLTPAQRERCERNRLAAIAKRRALANGNSVRPYQR